MASKICPKCGESNSSSAMHCISCNSSLTGISIKNNYSLPKRALRCPECKEKIEQNWSNCKNCGAILFRGDKEYSRNSEYRYSNYRNQDNNGFLYCMSFLIPLIGFIAGAVMLANSNDNGKTCIILGLISSIIGGIIIAFI